MRSLTKVGMLSLALAVGTVSTSVLPVGPSVAEAEEEDPNSWFRVILIIDDKVWCEFNPCYGSPCCYTT